MKLTDRTILITGGSAGIGLAPLESSNFILMCQLSCVEQGLSLVVLSAAKDLTPATRPVSDRSVRSLRMTEMSVAGILHVSSV